MSGAQTTRAKAAPNKGAAAARAETKAEPKGIKFREVELELPVELPKTFLFDLTIIKQSDEDASGLFDMVYSIVGHEQFVAIRNAIKPDDDVAEVLDTLIDDIFGTYGSSVGESSASQDS